MIKTLTLRLSCEAPAKTIQESIQASHSLALSLICPDTCGEINVYFHSLPRGKQGHWNENNALGGGTLVPFL